MASPIPSSLGLSGDTFSALTENATKLGAALDQAFVKASAQGKNFDQTLKSVEKSLVSLFAKAASRQLDQSFATIFGSSSASSTMSETSALIPFASGGILATPTAFGAGPRALAGEAGPEAILPLGRGPDGTLGLRSGPATTVNITIHAQDVESFRRSEAQVAAALTRALQRGRRAL